ncbi:hypothetical protein PENSPDRAFT_754541 [Peniophora sp. CONT]|nr:hypothetical protein PENSPDRAFT_754541 [Peniophora sp. CONT]
MSTQQRVQLDIDGQISESTSRVVSALQERISLESTVSREKQISLSGAHLATLDYELQEIDSYLAALRQQLNALAPVAHLPLEVLCQIFHYLSELHPCCARNPDHYKDIAQEMRIIGLGWIVVTQVCHAWREAALRDRRLWTITTTLLGNEWFATMLKLGRSRLKELDIWMKDPMPERLLELISTPTALSQLSRLHIYGQESNKSVMGNIHAPALDTLHIHYSYFVDQHALPRSLLGDPLAPAPLRDIYVHNLSVPPNILRHIHSLTHLSISLGPGTGESISFRDMCDTLSSMDALEDLTIQDYMFDLPDEGVFLPAAVGMTCPRLMNVNIYSESCAGVLLFLIRLRCARTAKMCFATTYPDVMAADMLHVIECLQVYVADAQRSPLGSMRVVEWRTYAPYFWQDRSPCEGPGAPYLKKALMLSTWRDGPCDHLMNDHTPFDQSKPCRPDFQLVLGSSDPESRFKPEDIIPFSSFPAACSVSVRPEPRQPLEITYVNGWQELFHTAQSLTWLRADREVAEDLLKCAHHDLELRNPQSPGPLPSSLQTLVLLGVRWDSGFTQELSTYPLLDKLNELGNKAEQDGTLLREVIVGAFWCQVPENMGLSSTHVKKTYVERPEWFTPDNEDWDVLAEK